MATVLILGGGFAGMVAAERLAAQLSDEHQITLVSRGRNFVFYPALVRLAFGKCEREEVSFDLRNAMLNRRVNFIEAEVAHLDPWDKKVTIAHGEVEGKLTYDYLVFALGRRLATERIPGFFEHAHHLLNVDKAIKFGKAISNFHEGHAVIAQCEGARLPVPVYETAFALACKLEKNGERERVRITVVTPAPLDAELGIEAGVTLKEALAEHQIQLLENFPIERVTANSVSTKRGDAVKFDLLMLVPPFRGSSAATYMEATDHEGYIMVDSTMRVVGHEGIYAVGDCVNFKGPKMAHMAVRQGEVAAANLAAEIEGHARLAHYSHEMKLVIDGFGGDSIYLHKDMWSKEPGSLRQGRFWNWAKRVQQGYWEYSHS
jgi:NADH dehydrogenase FAD-containing subunit